MKRFATGLGERRSSAGLGRRAGQWIVGVGVLHLAAGAMLHRGAILDMLQRGFVGSAGRGDASAGAAWFMLFGLLTVICGLAVAEIEGDALKRGPRRLAVAVLLLTVIGIAWMPRSGFWLMLPPAAMLLRAAFRRPDPW